MDHTSKSSFSSLDVGFQPGNQISSSPFEQPKLSIVDMLLKADFLDRFKILDPDVMNRLIEPDAQREIVMLLSIKYLPEETNLSFENYVKLMQILMEMFSEAQKQEVFLQAFLGIRRKSSEAFMNSSYDSRPDNYIQDSQFDPILATVVATTDRQPTNEVGCLRQNKEISDEFQDKSDNIILQFLDILNMNTFTDTCVQRNFNHVFTILLRFKPERIHKQLLERQEQSGLLKRVVTLLGDFEVADLLEKICFEVYKPSEDVCFEYLRTSECQVMTFFQEMIDSVLHEYVSDQFMVQNFCRIARNCSLLLSLHSVYSRFFNVIFEKQRVERYLALLTSSSSSMIRSEITLLLTTGLRVFTESSGKYPLNKDWLAVLLEGLRVIKSKCIDKVDSVANIIRTTFSQHVPAFGEDRLHLLDLLFEIVKLNDPCFVNELIMHDYPSKIFFFMFEYEWNNMLHEKVFAFLDFFVQQCLSSSVPLPNFKQSPSVTMMSHLILHVEVLKQIRRFPTADSLVLEGKGITVKRPNTPFVVKIAKSLDSLLTRCPYFLDFLDDQQRVKWREFSESFVKCYDARISVRLGVFEKEEEESINIYQQQQSSQFPSLQGESKKQVSSKLQERLRKNSGNSKNLFVLNPNGKKFSTQRLRGASMTEIQADLEPCNAAAEIEQDTSVSSISPRTKMTFSSQSRPKLCLGGIDNEDDEEYAKLPCHQFEANSDDTPLDHQKLLTLSSQLLPLTNSPEMRPLSDERSLDNGLLGSLDNLWESNRKHVITFGGRRDNVIFLPSSSSSSSSISSNNRSSEPKTKEEKRSASPLLFRRKAECKSKTSSSSDFTLLECINQKVKQQQQQQLKKKKFSYDEQHSEGFLISPRLLSARRKKRALSQPSRPRKQSDDEFTGETTPALILIDYFSNHQQQLQSQYNEQSEKISPPPALVHSQSHDCSASLMSERKLSKSPQKQLKQSWSLKISSEQKQPPKFQLNLCVIKEKTYKIKAFTTTLEENKFKAETQTKNESQINSKIAFTEEQYHQVSSDLCDATGDSSSSGGGQTIKELIIDESTMILKFDSARALQESMSSTLSAIK